MAIASTSQRWLSGTAFDWPRPVAKMRPKRLSLPLQTQLLPMWVVDLLIGQYPNGGKPHTTVWLWNFNTVCFWVDHMWWNIVSWYLGNASQNIGYYYLRKYCKWQAGHRRLSHTVNVPVNKYSCLLRVNVNLCIFSTEWLLRWLYSRT